MYVCICEAVTEAELLEAIRASDIDITFEDCVKAATTANACCKCLHRIKEIFDEEKQRDGGTCTS